MTDQTVTMKDLLELVKTMQAAPSKSNQNELVTTAARTFIDDYGKFSGNDVTFFIRQYDIYMDIDDISDEIRSSKFLVVVREELRHKIKNFESFKTKNWKML